VAYQEQLPLPDTSPVAPRSGQDDWRLDEQTRRAGRRGLAAARLALSRCAPADARRARAA